MRKNRTVNTEYIPEELAPKLAAEDTDETRQPNEEPAYYIGMNRGRFPHPGDELADWFEAERWVQENTE